MPLFGPKSMIVRSLSFQHGATNNVVWNCFATFLSQAMDAKVGIAVAVATINPAVAAPVIAIAVVCGVFRFIQSKRSEAEIKAFQTSLLAMAKRGEQGADVLAELKAGKFKLSVNLDSQAMDDLASVIDTRNAEPGSGLRQAVAEEFERVLAQYATFDQFKQLVAEYRENEETVRILLWTQDYRGREHDAELKAHGRQLSGLMNELSGIRDLLRSISPQAAALWREPDDFLARVGEACKAKFCKQRDVGITRLYDGAWGGEYLRVLVPDDEFCEIFPVAAVDEPATTGLIDRFVTAIHAPYRVDDDSVRSHLVIRGKAIDEQVKAYARKKSVFTTTFEEFRSIIPLGDFLAHQTAEIQKQANYLEEHYVKQRLSVDSAEAEPITSDALDQVIKWLEPEDKKFILILGSFGTGKSFLTKRLAIEIPKRLPDFKPLLIDMKDLEKVGDIASWLAGYLAMKGVRNPPLARISYMLREGRIVLIVDGYDELAVRVSYGKAADQLGILAAALEGKAKIIVTSRTQHFESDGQVNQTLDAKLPDKVHRIKAYLHDFTEDQIKEFLFLRLKDKTAAENRYKLLDEVTHLAKLAQNPRMLSYITEIDSADLEAVRAKNTVVTKAKLYEMLVKKWVARESERKTHKGGEPALTAEQYQQAIVELAYVCWHAEGGVITRDQIKTAITDAIERARAAGAPARSSPMDLDEAAQQMGSGSFLEDQGDRRHTFSHQSIAEWFIAHDLSRMAKDGAFYSKLSSIAVSDLIPEFLAEMIDRETLRDWAEKAISEIGRGRTARRNAALIASAAKLTLAGPAVFSRDHLEDFDIRTLPMAGATCIKAIMPGLMGENAVATRSRWTEAALRQAKFRSADLSESTFDRADLTEADFTLASLSGTSFTLAVLRRAKLFGSKGLSILGHTQDTFGAALPWSKGLAAQLHPLASSVQCVAYHPHGDLVASGHDDGLVGLWDAATGTLLRTLKGHTKSVYSVAFSPDGSALASGSSDNTVRLWNPGTGAALRTLEGHTKSVYSVAFSLDGSALASGSDDKTVRLWNPGTGAALRTLEGHTDSVWSVAFSPDGSALASGSGDNTVRLWNPGTGAALRTVEGHTGLVWSVAFSPDGSALASGSGDKTVRLWNPGTGAALRTLEGHIDSVWSVAFSPDGSALASGSSDNTVRLWNPGTGAALRTLEGHTDSVMSVAFNPDGSALASGSLDNTVRLWNPGTGAALRTLEGHTKSVMTVAFSPNGSALASASDDNSVRLWNPGTGAALRTLEGHTGLVWSVAFSPDGFALASGSSDNTVRLWNPGTGAALRTLEGHTKSVMSVAFSSDGSALASGSGDKTVRLWNPGTGAALRTLEGHTDSVLSVAFSPDGSALASGSDDNTVRLWNPGTGAALRTLEGHTDSVLSVAFSPDGSALASGSYDKTVRLWNPGTGAALRTLEGHTNWVWSVAFSPDGSALASGSYDKTVRLWNPGTGAALRTLEGHTNSVYSVAFSPDGSALASGSSDNTVRLWSVATGACLAILIAGEGGWVAMTPEGRYRWGGKPIRNFWYAINLCRYEVGELDDVPEAMINGKHIVLGKDERFL